MAAERGHGRCALGPTRPPTRPHQMTALSRSAALSPHAGLEWHREKQFKHAVLRSVAELVYFYSTGGEDVQHGSWFSRKRASVARAVGRRTSRDQKTSESSRASSTDTLAQSAREATATGSTPGSTPGPLQALQGLGRGSTEEKATNYSAELLKTPLGLGLSLGPNDDVTEIRPDSQAARGGKINVGDRIVSINGETPTTAKPSFAILQGIATGTTLKLEFVSADPATPNALAMSSVSSISQQSMRPGASAMSASMVRRSLCDSLLGRRGRGGSTASPVDRTPRESVQAKQMRRCLARQNGVRTPT